MPVLQQREPLLEGESPTWAIYVPKALKKAIERAAARDGFDKISPYACELLVAALRQREAELAAEAAARK